jgi:Ser/Thr protein kinase RdoA (MazF antagonist)
MAGDPTNFYALRAYFAAMGRRRVYAIDLADAVDVEAMAIQLADVLRGYREFHDFDRRELRLIEALRTLRMIHYAGWLAVRWGDPAFPASFPWFNTQRYWQDQVLALREQCAVMDEPPLELPDY